MNPKNSKEKKPFFIVYSFKESYTPLQVQEIFQNTSLKGPYGDSITNIDYTIGRTLDYLNYLGISEDTMVMFTSNNGPNVEEREDGGSSGPFKGGRGQSYEGGFRVPFLLWNPYCFSNNCKSSIHVLTRFISHDNKVRKRLYACVQRMDGFDFSDVFLSKCRLFSTHIFFLLLW